jgi:hypothetical protein
VIESTEPSAPHAPCCSAHNVPMSCERYRRTHFVEVRPCCSTDAVALEAERRAAYDEGRWCGECRYGVVMDPPCCTQGLVSA